MNSVRKPNAKAARNRLIMAVHVAAKKYGIEGDDYRDMLRAVTGKDSCAALTGREMGAVLDHLNSGRRARRVDELPQAKKIRALWISGYWLGVVRDKGDAALRAFVRRQTGIEAENWLRDPKDARKVIEALKSWLARETGVAWDAHGADPDAHRWCVFDAQLRRLQDLGVYVDIAAVGRRVTGEPARFGWDSRAWDHMIAVVGAELRGHLGLVGAE